MAALEKGRMSVFLAGKKEVANHILPLIKCSFHIVLYTGKLGTALIPKAISNNFTCLQLIAASEALMIAKKAGMDLKVFWDCIRASAGNSFVWETGAPFIMNGSYDPSFTIDLQCKDNNLVMKIADDFGVPLELMSYITAKYSVAKQKYGDDAPCYIGAKMIEDTMKENLQCEKFDTWSYGIDNIDGSCVIRHKGIDLDENSAIKTL